MKRNLLLVLMVLLPMAVLITVTSCSKDDEIAQPPVNNNGNDNNGQEVPDIVVVVNEDGTTSNGSIFSAIDEKNFYVDYIKYTVEEGHLVVSGYDKTGFKGVANIITRLTYKGNTYEVLTISKDAFINCAVLTSVTISNSVTSIGEFAFYGCSGLTSISIGCGITNIVSGEVFFAEWEDRSTSIGGLSLAFHGCSSLTSVKVAEGNTKYDSRANCNAIIETSTNTLIFGCKNTIIPESVTCIGNSAFYYCSSLISVTIPNSVTSIGSSAFYGCSSLTSITIPQSVTSIGEYAFLECSSLASITIPNSVTSIGPEAFYNCWFVKNKFINNSTLTDSNNWGATLCDIETGEGLLIKDNIVFRCRSWATTVTVPNSVTSIGSDAFRGCSSLLSVTIGNSVTSIGSYSFYDCTSLTSVIIGNCVTSIGWYAFNGCNNLTTVIVKATTPPTIFDYDTFSNQSNATLYVPVGCKAAYQAAPYWKDFKVIIEN